MLGSFYEVPLSQIKITKRKGRCLLRAISYLLEGTEELYAYISLNVTELIKTNGTHKQKAQGCFKQSKVEKK